ncbi:hypothetical protein L1987_18105 [Smallanthus sonchifolius]|uniref:Uncharacterized protein n=1 Tax=Smallanthus sonchifolius TaxID=185202 RepID=A0ACB9IYT6_9ASTR|nr:hypothetical protein L1987_18105 [Smallanthus sonchifolius]
MENAPAYLASTQEYLCILVKYARAICPAHLLSAQASGQTNFYHLRRVSGDRKSLVKVAEKNLGNLLNYDNEIGTPQKPPKLLNVNDYSNWKARFEHYISYTDSSLWIPILEGYKHPTHIYLDETMPKPISKLSDEEKKAYDREKKALGSITMTLTRELFHSFRGYLDEEMVEKFLDALPPKFEMYTTLMRENPKFYELTVEEAIGKVQAHGMNLRRKESSGRPQIQDPSMYHGTTSTSKSSGSGIALFTGNPTEEDHSTGCGGHACYASGSGWQAY